MPNIKLPQYIKIQNKIKEGEILGDNAKQQFLANLKN